MRTDRQTRACVDGFRKRSSKGLSCLDLEGESKDASGRGHVLGQPFGLGPHQPQDLCFGTVSHGPLQQGLQGLPVRPMEMMSAAGSNQRLTLTAKQHRLLG